MNENSFCKQHNEIRLSLQEKLNLENKEFKDYISKLDNALNIDLTNLASSFYEKYSKKEKVEHIDFVNEYIDKAVKKISDSIDFYKICNEKLSPIDLEADDFTDIFRIYNYLSKNNNSETFFLSEFIENKAEKYLKGLLIVDEILKTISYEDRILVATKIYQDNYFFDCYKGLFDFNNYNILLWLVSIWVENLLPFRKLHYTNNEDVDKCATICSKYCYFVES